MTRKGTAWVWRKDMEQKAFEALKAACLQNDILAAPDFHKGFYVDVDASGDGYGFCIYQLREEAGGRA